MEASSDIALFLLITEMGSRLGDPRSVQRFMQDGADLLSKVQQGDADACEQALLSLWRGVAMRERDLTQRMDTIDAEHRIAGLPSTNMVQQRFQAMYERQQQFQLRLEQEHERLMRLEKIVMLMQDKLEAR